MQRYIRKYHQRQSWFNEALEIARSKAFWKAAKEVDQQSANRKRANDALKKLQAAFDAFDTKPTKRALVLTTGCSHHTVSKYYSLLCSQQEGTERPPHQAYSLLPQ